MTEHNPDRTEVLRGHPQPGTLDGKPKRDPDCVEVLHGHLLIGTADGYAVGDIYSVDRIAAPLTNLQCAKLWLADRPLLHKDTNAPVT